MEVNQFFSYDVLILLENARIKERPKPKYNHKTKQKNWKQH